MRFRILFGAAMMVASSGAMATGLVGTTGIASAHPSSGRPMAYTCSGGEFNPADPPRPPSWLSRRGFMPESRLRVCATYGPMP